MLKEKNLKIEKRIKQMELSREQKKEVRAFSREVAPYYKLFNWTWGEQSLHPTPAEITEVVYSHIRYLNENDAHHITSGGIAVEKDDGGVLTISWSKTNSIWI